MSTMKILIILLLNLSSLSIYANSNSIAELEKRPYLDDYLSNVLLGYRIINDTQKFAYRYTGNKLNCSSCHLKSGTKKLAFPLNVSGMYPKWRDKNGRRNGIGLRIRECFVYSLNGIMPPEDSPEVMALSAYISHLSDGEIIGEKPEGRGTVILPDTGFSPNPANGKVVYDKKCINCHQKNGKGTPSIPAVWGLQSFNKGSGMYQNQTLAGWVWKNMPLGNEESLSVQESKDVAAYINSQIRPADPRDNKLLKILENIVGFIEKPFSSRK